MKRIRSILRVVAVGLVLAGAAVLTGCGDSRRHISYGGRDHGPVYSRGGPGWGGHSDRGRSGPSRDGGRSGRGHDGGSGWRR